LLERARERDHEAGHRNNWQRGAASAAACAVRVVEGFEWPGSGIMRVAVTVAPRMWVGGLSGRKIKGLVGGRDRTALGDAGQASATVHSRAREEWEDEGLDSPLFEFQFFFSWRAKGRHL